MAEAGLSSMTSADRNTLIEDASPTETRERTYSGSTSRSSFYDQQRTGRRPPNPSISAKAKGKKANVDFQDLPLDSKSQPAVTQETGIDGKAAAQPKHARGDSYPNFSRPESVSRNNSKNSELPTQATKHGGKSTAPAMPARSRNHTEAGATNAEGDEAVIADDPDHPEGQTSADRTGADGDEVTMDDLPSHVESTKKQKRASATSSAGVSRKLRPPKHQSDLEKTSSRESAPVPPFAQSVSSDHHSRRDLRDLPPQPSTRLHELYVVSYLIFFSFIGTLARTGIEWLTFYPGAIIITPVIWANFAGSFFMGFLAEDKKMFQDEWDSQLLTPKGEKRMSRQSAKSKRSTFSQDLESLQHRERAKIKKTVPLYVGLTTGFCGSFTSFSIFARDMFLALANGTPSPINHPALPPAGLESISVSATLPRSGGYSFMAVIAVMITTLALSIGGLVAGKQFAQICEAYMPRLSSRFTRLFLDRIVVVVGFGCWLGAIILVILPPDRPGGPVSSTSETWRGVELFAMVFAPVGCLSRHYLSVKMNGLVTTFPLGTFGVNMLGTAILAMCYDLQHIGIGVDGSIGGGLLGCQALEGMIDGFTGCLTTVSTWVAEIESLKRKHSWLYALSTIIGGLCLVVAIMGPVYWTVGFSNPICITSYTNKY